MKILILCSLLLMTYTQVFGAGVFKKSGDGSIAPFSVEKMPVAKFVKNYAEATGVMITTEGRGLKGKVTMTTVGPLDTTQFQEKLFEVLDTNGLMAVKVAGGLAIKNTRDVRYYPAEIFTRENYPKTFKYIMMYIQMDYALGDEVTRSLRPFISRYGRIISFKDNKGLIIQDRGVTMKRVLSLIDSFDKRANYEEKREASVKNAIEKGKMNAKDKVIKELKKELNEEKRKRDRVEDNVKQIERKLKKMHGGRNV